MRYLYNKILLNPFKSVRIIYKNIESPKIELKEESLSVAALQNKLNEKALFSYTDKEEMPSFSKRYVMKKAIEARTAVKKHYKKYKSNNYKKYDLDKWLSKEMEKIDDIEKKYITIVKAVNQANSFLRGDIFAGELERLHEAKELVQSVNDGTLTPILNILNERIKMENKKVFDKGRSAKANSAASAAIPAEGLGKNILTKNEWPERGAPDDTAKN